MAANPGILGDDLLIIGKEFSGFDQTSERLDLLAVDLDGRLVIIELKRDDTGSDAHWQAIKYASYFQRATADSIIRMTAEYRSESEEEAATALLRHLGADDLNALNNDQRIIIASHRFAPEVTSAALWLNQKAPGDDLITCVKLTPHFDPQNGALYVQASTIIPVPEAEQYLVGIGSGPRAERIATGNNNRDDEITHFLRWVSQTAIAGLPNGIRPDRTSKWGAGWPDFRYYHLWYARRPWNNHGLSYRVHLYRPEETAPWTPSIWFGERSGIAEILDGLVLHPQQTIDSSGKAIGVMFEDGALDEELAQGMADVLRNFIEQITPIIDDLENEVGEEESAEA